jgi:mannose-6-phosphate isomerase-like protein (cupin superfamily)
MAGYTGNIEAAALENTAFRRVLYTSSYIQLVLMCIPIAGDIGEETHGLDQFIRVEAGNGKAVLNGEEHTLTDGYAIVVPAGTLHNILNTGDTPLKLYSLYAPPHHKDGVVHMTKADAEADHEEYLGDTTENV